MYYEQPVQANLLKFPNSIYALAILQTKIAYYLVLGPHFPNKNCRKCVNFQTTIKHLLKYLTIVRVLYIPYFELCQVVTIYTSNDTT